MREITVNLKNTPPDAPLRILMAGESFCDGSYYIERDDFSQAVIEYVVSGKGTLTVNDETVYPQTGDVYLVPPLTHHRYTADALHPWHKLWLNIDGPFVPQLFAAYGLQGVLLVRHFPEGEKFAEILNALQENHSVSAARALELAGGLIARIGMYQLQQHPERKEVTPENLHFSEQEAFSLKELCRSSGLSEAQTIRRFRKKYGKTPYAFYLEHKLELSLTLLASTELPVKVVALECGFPDAAYFSRLFRKKQGMPPLEYRRKHQKMQRGKRDGYTNPHGQQQK